MRYLVTFILSLFFTTYLSGLYSQEITAQRVLDYRDDLCSQGFDFIMKNNDVDVATALAVVMPELIRYDCLKDQLETMALKMLYMQYGKNYANFSIGRFQMKPSFAEGLEYLLLKSGTRKFMSIVADTSNSEYARKKRVERLSSINFQMQYLALFMTVVECGFPEVEQMSEWDRVRFYATAYNYGFNMDAEQIIARQKKREYHTALFRTHKTKTQNYSEVSLKCYLYLVK